MLVLQGLQMLITVPLYKETITLVKLQEISLVWTLVSECICKPRIA